MPINKIDVARRQTEAAIRMLFDGQDILPLITVSHAADEILSSLTKKRPDSMRSRILALIHADRYKDFWDLYNRTPNFLKHSSSNAGEEIDEPAETYVDGILATCCVTYRDLAGANTPTMEAYLGWYMVLHPDVLGPGRQRDLADGEGGAMVRALPRSEQVAWGKRLLGEMLAAAG